MSSLRSSTRRGIAAAGLIGVFALGITACGNVTKSDSDACGKGSSGGNVTTCFEVGDLSDSKTPAVIPAGTSVTIVCGNSKSVGIIVPKEIVNAHMDQVEWKTKGGASAIRSVPTDYLRNVPAGLPDCDSELKQVN